MDRTCHYCKSDTTYTYPDGRVKWFRVKDVPDAFMCRNCKYKYDYREKTLPRVSKNNKRRLQFKGKRIYLKENPRKGKCSNPKCSGTCELTHMHHKEYHDSDPLKDTEELCASCHAIISIELGQSLWWIN